MTVKQTLTTTFGACIGIDLCISMKVDDFEVWSWSLTRDARGRHINGYEADASARDDIGIADISIWASEHRSYHHFASLSIPK